MAEGAISQALYSRPRWWSEPFTRRFIPKLVGARMLLPRPFHLPTSIGRTFFPNLPAMPRVPGLEAVCTQATALDGLFNYSPRAFHHIIAANSASRGGHSSKRLRPFHQNAPAFSAKRSGHFSETLQPFQRNTSVFSAKRHGLFTKKRHRTEQGFSLCPARCLDVQTIVRCLLLADLAHRQVGCGSSHKD